MLVENVSHSQWNRMVSLDASFDLVSPSEFWKLRNSNPATMFEILNLTRPLTSSTEMTGQISCIDAFNQLMILRLYSMEQAER